MLSKQHYTIITLKVLFCSVLLGCAAHEIGSMERIQLDSKAESEQFIDSLKAIGTDSILGIYEGCVGCIRGVGEPYYVFWNDNGSWKLTKFTTT